MCVAVALAIVPLSSCGAGHDTSSDGVGAAAPSPLFGTAEEVRLDELPDGWARCGGGPSNRPEATGKWWSQTFGPASANDCQPWVTVTQIPVRSGFELPSGAIGTKVVDNADAARWTDDDTGTVGIFAWAFDQDLLIEACCDSEVVKHLDAIASSVLLATRQVAPEHCTSPSSDLTQEPLIENLVAKLRRVSDTHGCPLRSDLALMYTEDPSHHCWPDLETLIVGSPIGASTRHTEARTYRRDPKGETSEGVPDPRLDLDAVLSPEAASTGYNHEGRAIWIDEADDSLVYIVKGDTVEAWPRDRRDLACG